MKRIATVFSFILLIAIICYAFIGIHIEGSPEGASVKIVDTKENKTVFNDALPSDVPLMPGIFKVTVSKDGYYTHNATIEFNGSDLTWFKHWELPPENVSGALKFNLPKTLPEVDAVIKEFSKNREEVECQPELVDVNDDGVMEYFMRCCCYEET